ncbi:MAG: hypothetical protein JG781_2324 [Peptococcaceae bacterium]|jgi:uncharacterized protein YlxW (UPF0749 family)|uniref:DUF881 domain-containing protein n=1 Tax=Thermanaerosceptrum fracticalcis TaxID=1712410 RepID=A0A7G6E3E0_THEFR|nr:DUF881 domain-containing protein [Thermanaerosceptrum fracticalcis]MBZ4654967.1 hypothetical protein [Peptococcaceae bacterium]QNB46594.1 DUF881 domain-containing protein [Thermanaerosceptrum fracticalcis]
MRKWLVPITLVCIISGFFLAFQLKVQASNTTINPLSQKNTNLVTIIKDLEKEIKIQENQIERTRNDLNALQNQQSSRKLQELKNQLDRLKVMAGLTPVVGNGIIIVIDDNKAGLKANPNDDPNKYIVHYEHILNLVSELKVGGAEAISVNGQRLITTSEIRCVGNVILVNTTRIAPPFEIRAIGSPKLLAEIVTNGELELLKSSNYPVTLQEETELIIPAYKGELQFNYSQPAKEG